MSMIANYRRVTPDELEVLLRKPSTIVEYLFPEDGEEYEGVSEDGQYLTSPEDERNLDIDKSWHAIHYLLTGDAWQGNPPLANAVLGGTELGEEDVGYGPCRYLTPEEVREVASALVGIPVEELRRRYDPVELEKADIYPNIWIREGDEGLEYVLEYYEALVRFFRSAAEAGDGMLLYLT